MKITKIILLFITISFFTSVPNSAQALADCSEFKKLSHKWLMCKAGSNVEVTADEDAKKKAKKEKKKIKKEKKEKAKKEKKNKTFKELFENIGWKTE